MKISVMQPYFSPYLGYFQMINAVDKFIFYDDVNYIKNGWVNRNKININGKEYVFTIPIKNQSSFKKINETNIDWTDKGIEKLIKTFKQEYKNKNKELLERIINLFLEKPETISDLAINSINLFCDYLEITTEIKKSSQLNINRSEDRVDNLIKICNLEGCIDYINPIGGSGLYEKEDFLNKGVNLYFIQGKPSLSIIDVCMNNDKQEVIKELSNFKLI
jgi:hypothetical protein